MHRLKLVLVFSFLMISGILLVRYFIDGIKITTTIETTFRIFIKYLAGLGIVGIALMAIDRARIWLNRSHLHNMALQNIVVIFSFLMIVLLPTVGLLVNSESRIPTYENRTLAQRPSLGSNTISSFPTDFNNYINDNFGLRKMFISLNSFIKSKYLHSSQVTSVILGKSNWLFLEESAKDSLGWTRFSDDQLAILKANIEEQNNRLVQRGTYYLIVIAPNKETIYPEYLPDTIQRSNYQTRMDQLLQYLISENSTVPILDLRRPLLQAKTTYPLYWQTDTHWNNYGAFIAYSEIMKKLSDQYPSLRQPSSSDYDIIVREVSRSGDLANMLSLHDQLVDEESIDVELNPQYIDDNRFGSGLVFWDSFYEAVDPFMSKTFMDITKPERSHNFDYGWAESKKYDIVINLITERRLHALLANIPG
jgi:hypothetical protein